MRAAWCQPLSPLLSHRSLDSAPQAAPCPARRLRTAPNARTCRSGVASPGASAQSRIRRDLDGIAPESALRLLALEEQMRPTPDNLRAFCPTVGRAIRCRARVNLTTNPNARRALRRLSPDPGTRPGDGAAAPVLWYSPRANTPALTGITTPSSDGLATAKIELSIAAAPGAAIKWHAWQRIVGRETPSGDRQRTESLSIHPSASITASVCSSAVRACAASRA